MSAKIIGTTDYKMFKYENGNRQVDKAVVRRLIKSINKHNMLTANPIIINAKGYIIDGQHRLEAAKFLKIPVYYVVVEPASLTDIHLLNANMRPWTIRDFLNSYIKLGKKDYIKFKEFHEKYGFPFSATMSLLTERVDSGGIIRKFKQGEFEVVDLDHATKMADRIIEMKPYLNVRTFTSSRFYRTIFKLMKDDINLVDRIIEKIQANGKQIYPCDNKIGYLRQFEDVLNIGKVGARVSLI